MSNPHQMMLQYLKNKQSQFDPTVSPAPVAPPAIMQEGKLAKAALAAGIAGSAFGIGAGIGAGGHGPNIPNPPMRHVDRGVRAGVQGQQDLLPASAPAQAAPAASVSKPTPAEAAAAGGALGLGAGAGLGALAGYSAGRRRRSVTESLTSTYLQMIRDRNLQEGGIGSAIGSIAGGALGLLAGPLAPVVSPALSAIGGMAGDKLGDAASTGKVGEDDTADETPKSSKGGRRRRIAGAVLGGLLGAGAGLALPLPSKPTSPTPPSAPAKPHERVKLPLGMGGAFDMRPGMEGSPRVTPEQLLGGGPDQPRKP